MTRPVAGTIAALGCMLLAFAIAAPAEAARTAYIANAGDNTVTPINTVANTAGSPFSSVGLGPVAIAITPDGTTALVPHEGSDNVVPFDLTTDPPTPGTPVSTGGAAFAIAISPDGETAYVANFDGSNEIVPIDIASNTAGTAIPVGGQPDAIAITPDGDTAYAANFGDGTVTPINLTTNPPTPGPPILVGDDPQGIAITPDGTKAYVANCGSNDVTVINTATNTVTATITVDDGPNAIAITPNGSTAYTPNCNTGTVTPITTATNTTGPEIPAGTLPYAIAITPDGKTVYVTNDVDPGEVTPIDISTSSPTPGASITVGSFPEAIAITPDQGPTAAFTAGSAMVGQATSFNGSGSSDPDGTVANYAWNFGDGTTASTSSATINHSYGAAGTYTARLTVTDNEGCSTAFIFTGQTASCNGSTVARIQHQVTVSKDTPNLSTTASSGVIVGGSIHDTATLAGGSNPTGTITFRLYGPNDANCSGSPAFTDVEAVAGNGAYDSAGFIPTQAGVYRWTASYSGDQNNNADAGPCNAADESVTVFDSGPTLTTNASANVAIGGQIHDTATLAAGDNPTGQITFRLYGPNDTSCTGSPIFTDTVSVAGDGDYQSADFTPSSRGLYRWTASYSGDSNNDAAATVCNEGSESVYVARALPVLTTQASEAVVVGGFIRDTATLASGQSPTGLIAFKLYGPNDDDCSGGRFGSRVSVAGNGDYRSARFSPARPGIYHWTARYSGDASNRPAFKPCSSRRESVWVQKASPELTTQASLAGTNRVGDRATLARGHEPRGQIVFRLFGPGDGDCSKAPVFTDRAPVSGNGAYDSARFSAPRPGTYRFTVASRGDVKNRAAHSPCNAPGESVRVQ